jgi:hypothetical protein
MDQDTAKRLFVWGLTWLEREVDNPDFSAEDYEALLATMPNAPEDLGDPDDLHPAEFLDQVAEHLWGCFDVIDAPASSLDVIGCKPGITYHDAILDRSVAWLSEQGDDAQVVRNLRAVFVKDQQGRHGTHAPIDRETFHQWLQGYLGPEADDLMKVWEGD